jgi:hypothetical protein
MISEPEMAGEIGAVETPEIVSDLDRRPTGPRGPRSPWLWALGGMVAASALWAAAVFHYGLGSPRRDARGYHLDHDPCPSVQLASIEAAIAPRDSASLTCAGDVLRKGFFAKNPLRFSLLVWCRSPSIDRALSKVREWRPAVASMPVMREKGVKKLTAPFSSTWRAAPQLPGYHARSVRVWSPSEQAFNRVRSSAFARCRTSGAGTGGTRSQLCPGRSAAGSGGLPLQP